MYRNFYGFSEKPFSMTPDPDFLYISKNHKEAFAHLFYGIRNKAGFIELIGEVGSGKTTVVRTLLNQLEKDHYRTALIFNPCLSALELLQNINREYGVPFDGLSNSELINSLNEFLLQENAAGRTVVLVVDEAQNLEPAVLEQIRLISNLETEKEKLIQILLVGQPELEEILNKQEMRQLSQRITVHYHLKPMDYADTVAYIDHRLEAARGNGKIVFSPAALKKIFRYSNGLPRLINIACERSLLAGYMGNSFLISGRMAVTAIADVTRTTKSRLSLRFLILSGLFLSAFLLAAGIFFSVYDVTGKVVPEKKIISDAVPTKRGMSMAEFFGAAVKELSSMEEKANIIGTFNAIAGLYDIPLLSNDETPLSLDKAFYDRRVNLYKYTGNLGSLLRMNCPAIMELNIPQATGNRYVALTGQVDDQLITAPPILGKTSLTVAEMEILWTGRSYIPWKNVREIPYFKIPGTQGTHVRDLQEMLKKAGNYKGPLTAVFNKSTKEAVKKFQAREGIYPDGIVGNQTLFLLYRKADDRIAVPNLSKGP
ncbi:MAG: AAA family ATPase [Syntrophaceae bacterium]